MGKALFIIKELILGRIHSGPQNFLQFGRKCFLCELQTAQRLLLCEDCAQELPWRQFHKLCYQCGMTLPYCTQNTLICGDCLKEKPSFDRVIASFDYAAPIKNIIKALKFKNVFYCAQFLALALSQSVKPQYAAKQLPQVLIPVPLHSQRLKERGFNQALEIAKKLSRKLAIPLDTRLCLRNKNSVPQSSLGAAQRRRQQQGFFIDSSRNIYEHVAIIDDVMTTGTTVNSLAQILRHSGVKQIDVWVCARTE